MNERTCFKTRQEEYVQAVEEQLERSLGTPDGKRAHYGVLIEAMGYSLLGAGKRLRAMLCLEFCRLGCGEWRRALPFAAAVEEIHAYSLIHDDLPCMDDDVLRRGKPSCHVRYGEWGALLAGDALLTLAFESALRDCDAEAVGAERMVRALRLLAQSAGCDGMVGGQVLDLQAEANGIRDGELLREMHALKTGALIRASCGMGAILGGMDGERLRGALRYADEIGLAFQITDDILDETSTPEEMGKSVGKDKESGKTTYVTLYGISRAKEEAEACTERAKAVLSEMGVPRTEPFLYELAERIVTRSH